MQDKSPLKTALEVPPKVLAAPENVYIPLLELKVPLLVKLPAMIQSSTTEQLKTPVGLMVKFVSLLLPVITITFKVPVITVGPFACSQHLPIVLIPPIMLNVPAIVKRPVAVPLNVAPFMV